MERLSVKKKHVVIGYYLQGMAYDAITAKTGVSKGAVANIIAELKAGKFPEAAGVAEQIEHLRELSLELKRANLTPGQCAVGLMVLNRTNECGLDPADIDRWPEILKSVRNEDEAQEFVRLVYSISEVQERTGLSLNALDSKVHDLEKKAADLGPVSAKLAACQKQLGELTRQRELLESTINGLEGKRKLLEPQVKSLERRAEDLSRRIDSMEPRAEKAETTFAALSKEIQRLEEIGFTLEVLAEFSQRLQVIAERHAVKPAELRAQLLHELESLDQALGLEALINSRQQELAEQKRLVTKARQELETTRAEVGSLKQGKTNLEASIKETTDWIGREIVSIMPLARDTIDKLARRLRSGVSKVAAEVRQVRDESLEVGREVGRWEGILEANAWLKGLLALVHGEPGIEAKQVRVVALLVVRGVHGWLRVNDKQTIALPSLTAYSDSLMRELEQWRV
jgi:predicted  nucleic acid-binding Zn-ribbon protein